MPKLRFDPGAKQEKLERRVADRRDHDEMERSKTRKRSKPVQEHTPSPLSHKQKREQKREKELSQSVGNSGHDLSEQDVTSTNSM